MHDKGNHPCLSEDWLIDNLPEGWTYDCVMGLYEDPNPQSGFLIGPQVLTPQGTVEYDTTKMLFIPLDLLKLDRKQV